MHEEIKKLTDKQLMDFQETGMITVGGHQLVEEDLRLMYKFDSKQGSANYDAHADRQVLSNTNLKAWTYFYFSTYMYI